MSACNDDILVALCISIVITECYVMIFKRSFFIFLFPAWRVKKQATPARGKKIAIVY